MKSRYQLGSALVLNLFTSSVGGFSHLFRKASMTIFFPDVKKRKKKLAFYKMDTHYLGRKKLSNCSVEFQIGDLKTDKQADKLSALTLFNSVEKF